LEVKNVVKCSQKLAQKHEVRGSVSKCCSDMWVDHRAWEECEILVYSGLYWRVREVVSTLFWETFLRRNDPVLVKKVALVLQEVVIVEVPVRSHAHVSSRMDFWGEHNEVTETDGEEVILVAHLFAERNGVGVFLLLEHIHHLYLYLRDFVIACENLLVNDFEVLLPSDL
jgi:hypothetical protein